MDRIIKQTSNGFISFCPKCNAYSVEFGNLFFRFTEDEFQHFRRYIASIDGEHYQKMNRNLKNARKIFLRMPVKGFYCVLHQKELEELRRLVDFSRTEDEINSLQELHYYSLN